MKLSNAILLKKKQLLELNNIEPNYSLDNTDSNTLRNIMSKQEKLMNELKILARANNTLLGRTVTFPMGDSYAYYLVTKINKKTVEVTNLRYCDAWQDSRLGYCGKLQLEYVSTKIKNEDNFEKFINK